MKITVTDISLLKKAEYDYVSDILRNVGVKPGFWLKNKNLNKEEVDAVAFSCFTTSAPPYINADVHPILDVSISNPRVHVGDVIRNYAGCDWVVLFENNLHFVKRVRIFSIASVATRKFDDKTVIFEKSDIKNWLEEWVEYATMGIEDEDFEVTDYVSFYKETESEHEYL